MDKHLVFFALLLFPIVLFAQPERIIKDSDLNGNQIYNWSSDTVYLLDGYVFLETGSILNIEAGTVIKARLENITTGDLFSALIITQGAQIIAVGEHGKPIIFTAEADNLEDPTDLTVDDKGLWGGLVLLGKAKLGPSQSAIQQGNYLIDNFQNFYDAERSVFGGNDDQDNSGTLRYVSIRHSGAAIPDLSMGGLNLAGVGDQTTVEFIEISGGDLAIHIEGGTVNVKNFVGGFNSRGTIVDKGWRGKGQFWFGVKNSENNLLQFDQPSSLDYPIFTYPEIQNATFIGPGINSPTELDNPTAIVEFRGEAGGRLKNSIIIQSSDLALVFSEAELDGEPTTIGSVTRLWEGNLQITNNIFFDISHGNSFTPSSEALIFDFEYYYGLYDEVANHLYTSGNLIVDPTLISISREPIGQLDPRPMSTVAYSGLAENNEEDDFFESVAYKGAFGPETNLWAKDWTYLDEAGYFPETIDPIELSNSLPEIITYDSTQFIISFPDDMSESELLLEEQRLTSLGATKLKECWCADSLPRVQLWGVEDKIDLDAGRNSGRSRLNVDTIELNYDLILDPIRDFNTIENYCILPPQRGSGSHRVKVAVIDSGMDLGSDSIPKIGHPFLQGILYLKSEEFTRPIGIDHDNNCIANDKFGYDYVNGTIRVEDYDGHGTHIAGIIADDFPADAQLELVNFKVYDRGDGGLFGLVCAIHEAVDMGVDVISLSLGYYSEKPSKALYLALERAEEAGIPVVVSAGNDGLNNDIGLHGDADNRWPGNFRVYEAVGFRPLSNILVVGAANREETDLAFFSNWGPQSVAIIAKGSGIRSTFLHNGYETLDGSSMAVGFAVRTIALIKAYRQNVEVQQILDCIRDTAKPLANNLAVVEWGILDSKSALACFNIELEEKQESELGLVVDSILVYPNPFRDWLVFDLMAEENRYYPDVEFSVYSAIGRQVFHQVCDYRMLTWNGRDNNNAELPPGIYICRVSDGKDERVFTIAKQ